MSHQPITIISSTNRQGSMSLKISNIYRDLLTAKGISSTLISLEEMPADFIETGLYDKAGSDDSFQQIRTQMKEASKMVFIVPEYNGSFPGVLKTFIDGLIFPATFTNKKIALVGVSSGIQGSVLAMSHLTDIFNYCGANVLANKPKLSGIDSKVKDGQLVDDLYLDLLNLQIEAFSTF